MCCYLTKSNCLFDSGTLQMKRLKCILDATMQQGIKNVDFSSNEELINIYKSNRQHTPQTSEFNAFLQKLHHEEFQKFIATYLIHCGVSTESSAEVAGNLSHFLCTRKKKNGKDFLLICIVYLFREMYSLNMML